MMSTFQDLIATLPTELVVTNELAKEAFEMPRLPQAQCIVLPLLRETIAPILIRNNDPEMTTDMQVAGANRIRMIASKTKGVERRRGAQVLRFLGLGGYAPANKAYRPSNKAMSEVFDLNTLVFGDSAKGSEKAIYPVHAAVLYSDALSVEPINGRIDSVFRQGGVYEDGGTYDIEHQGTSSNIFTTYSVMPGTRLVQTLVLTGNRLTIEAFNHLLLSIGLASAYGGATAVTGTNIKTVIAGIYWGSLERPINAPSQILPHLDSRATTDELTDKLAELFQTEYPLGITVAEVQAYVADLTQKLDREEPSLLRQYGHSAQQAAELFDAWFGNSANNKSASRKRARATQGVGDQ